jgi:hypothetical protein
MLQFMNGWQKEDIHCFDVQNAVVGISYNGRRFPFLGNEYYQTEMNELGRP